MTLFFVSFFSSRHTTIWRQCSHSYSVWALKALRTFSPEPARLANHSPPYPNLHTTKVSQLLLGRDWAADEDKRSTHDVYECVSINLYLNQLMQLKSESFGTIQQSPLLRAATGH